MEKHIFLAIILLSFLFIGCNSPEIPEKSCNSDEDCVIALKTLGPLAAPCMCIAVVLACLTTAVVLTSLFADFLRKDLLREKVGNKTSLILTLLLAFLVSTLEFSGIMMFLGPLVEMIYPALIMLTVVNIFHKTWGLKNSHWPTTLTLALKICSAVAI